MRRRLVVSLSLSLSAAVLAAGCGSSGQDGGSAPSVDAPAPRTAAPLRVGVTDARVGDATTASDRDRAVRELSAGARRVDPSAARPTLRQREGVAGGEGCAERDRLPAGENLDAIEETTLCLLNGERRVRGLRPLVRDDRLAKAARGHARAMVEDQFFAHESRDGRQITDRIRAAGWIPSDRRWWIGENLAWGTGALATPQAIVNAWMNSAGHRTNILNRRYQEIGFGIVTGNPTRRSGQGATYATEFGGTESVGTTLASTRSASSGQRAARRRAAQRRAAARKARARKARARRAAARR